MSVLVFLLNDIVVKTVQTQVVLQGVAGRELWLGSVDLRRGGANITGVDTGWMCTEW